MANWWSEVTTAPKAPPPGGGSVDWWKETTAPAASPRDPDILRDRSKSVGLGARAISGFSSGDEETVRYFASQLYPDEPLEQAAARFGTRNGRLYHKADDGKLYEAVPSKGIEATTGDVLSGAGKAIPAATGLAAGIVTAPLATSGVGLAGTIGAAYAGGAGGEAVRQKVGDYLMGDASTGDLNATDIAGEGLYSAAGQAGGAGVGRVAERAQVRDISRLNPVTTKRAYDMADQERIRITPGQGTGLKTVQAEEKRLATRDQGTMDEMDDFLDQQSRDVQDAWHRKLNTIAPQRDAEETGNAVRKAAQETLDDYRQKRSAAAKPFYDAWREQRRGVETSPVLKNIDRDLTTVARTSAEEKALNTVKTYLTSPDGEAVVDPLRLHSARMNIQSIIETRSVDGTPINNTIVGKLKKIQNELTAAMDAASIDKKTGQSLYKQARNTFSTMSGDVDDAFDSALARIADLNDTSILRTAREAFDPNTRSPVMISRLKAALSKKDPAAWQDLKRLWLQDTVSDKLKTAQTGDVLNPAGKILSALEDAGTRRSIEAALTAPEIATLDDFKFLMRKISSAGLAMKSDTAANIGADSAALKSATPIWAAAQRKLVSLVSFWDWTKATTAVADAAAERNLQKQSAEMVKLVTSGDRDAINSIRQLRKLTPLQWRALAASGQLTVRGLPVAVGLGSRAMEGPEGAPNE